MNNVLEKLVTIQQKKKDQKKRAHSRLLEFKKENKSIKEIFIKFKHDKEMTIAQAVEEGFELCASDLRKNNCELDTRRWKIKNDRGWKDDTKLDDISTEDVIVLSYNPKPEDKEEQKIEEETTTGLTFMKERLKLNDEDAKDFIGLLRKDEIVSLGQFQKDVIKAELVLPILTMLDVQQLDENSTFKKELQKYAESQR